MTQNVARVCAITDPFCSHALGSKTPDTSSVRTFAYPSHVVSSFSCDVNGNLAVLVWPSFGTYPLKRADVVSAVHSEFTTDFVAYHPIPLVTRYRNVSYGIRIRNTTAPLSSGGLVRIRTYGEVPCGSFLALDRASFACDSYLDIPLQDCHDVAIIGRKVSAQADLFHNAPLTMSVIGQNPTFWGPIVIDVAGAVSGASISVELLLHQEFVLDDTSGLQLLATAPPQYSPKIVDASARIQSASKTIFDKGMAQASKFVEDNAAKFLSMAVEGAMLLL